ncbi:Nuclear pore complex subunit Nup159, putative [Penicillium digitatum PHI26]|uniref:Nuclear pore complex subunit Nup159, putative n=2 Tax=Penicillium digitatum TaxID=36651 RepID=K9GVF2_PEND2|nr:Nuclear pore complex subunit Nup159, putative [Penicillium digitatum Pd1]EKV16210.1 Nuclear pore complex subunit Nup159, putative [Penicillium digitatum Pd1]EKV18608.1 Nuclear pore complex subunit Nup159, putative [Penicillium digitatum PHI26]
MAFNFGASNPAGESTSAELGSELPDVFTDEVGFKGVSGDANIRFLPTAWPDNALPAPTSSLLAVAHIKGLVVGAGPDTLVISTTDVVRKSIEAPAGEDMEKTKPFKPIATIPLPSRPTHVAFTPGEDGLILATENGPGISVFDTNALTQGNAQPAISIPTNGVSLRALAPNPDPSSTLVALVTMNGDLLIADLKAGSLLPGPNGPVLKDGVSCASWSNKGKQLIAGLADGTGYQMTPDGTKKAEVPRPSDLEGDCHISSIAWLENDVFFVTYTPNVSEDDMGMNPPSSYYIITRRKQAPFLIQKLPEVCSTMGFMLKRGPAYQFITRIREYKPHLRDVLIVASTASTDLGLITRSDQPLANDDRTKSHVGQFMTTEVSDDTKRASVPLKDSGDETSVIGLAQNLSATENVVAPLPGSDILESSTPLPGVLLLNNDGILSSWWFVYADSIRQNIPYSGLISSDQAMQAHSQPQAVASTPAPTSAQKTTLCQPSFGSLQSFGQSAFSNSAGASPFGSPSAPGASTMGATGLGKQSAPAFSSLSQLGGSTSPFGKTSSPAPAHAFGTPSQPGVSFGTLGTPAQPKFGQSGFGTKGPGFGQSSSPANPFGAKFAASGGGFSPFSGGDGFSSFATVKAGESPFAVTQSKGSPFANASAGQSAFANSSASPFGSKPQVPTSFPPPASSKVKNPFGAAQGGFELKSTFKGDGSAANDLPKANKTSSGSLSFGGSFDEMVSTPRKGSSSPSESMDDAEEIEPVNKETFSIFGGASKPASQTPTSMFSSKTQFSKAMTPAENPKPAFSMFGTTADQKRVTSSLSALSDKTETPKKTWSNTSSINVETPLPPDPITPASYAAEDAPLPPDFTKAKKSSPKADDDAPLPPDFLSKKKIAPKTDDAPLPPDFLTKKPVPKTDDAPLPPDFLTRKQSAPKIDDAPLPPDFLTKPRKSEAAVVPEDAPLPPNFTAKPKTKFFEEATPIPDESDESGISDGDSEAADESDFSDSGEEITHDEAIISKSKQSTHSSFGAVSEQSSTRGFFSSPARNADDQARLPRQLFGEIPKQPLLPPPGPIAQSNREPYRSPSPVRAAPKKNVLFSEKSHGRKGSTGALHSRKASLTQIAQRDGHLRKASDVAREEQEKQARAHAAAQLQEDDVLSLSDDDEDDRLRDELAQPVEPVDTLDPFLPHQNYMCETAKPGIAGQVERLYRDINSMVDTLGINARSMVGFLLHQQPKKPCDIDEWVMVLNSDQPAEILDTNMTFKDIERFEELIASIAQSLNNQRVQGVDEKLDACRDLLTKQVVTLRSQFASIRKTLDAHTDVGTILEAPLSAEQGALQQDVRTTFTNIQVKITALEQAVSLLRAKIADVSQANGTGRNRPTVEAVTKTIATMMSMAEGKSTDIDVLEAQMRKLGVDIAPTGPPSREASPFSTPHKNTAGRIPMTPGSRGSIDGSAYHTPDSVSRGLNFRASINGSVRQSRLRNVEGAGEPALPQEDIVQYKARKLRRQHLKANLKKALEDKQAKVLDVQAPNPLAT